MPLAERRISLHHLGGFNTRLLTSAVLIPLTFILITMKILHPGFTIFAMAFACVGSMEYISLVRKLGIYAEGTLITVGSMLVVGIAYWGRLDIMILVFTLWALLIMIMHVLRRKRTLAGLAAAIFGLFYMGWLPSHFVLMHENETYGTGLVLFVILVTICSDTGAYLIGKSMGKRKLAPWLSPKKTWEGSIGGTVLAALGALLLPWLAQQDALRLPFLERQFAWPLLPDFSWWTFVGLGILLSVVGQIGDLTESMIKRDAGIKDSGSIFPGHGGVLDRSDSLLFAGPLMYYIFLLMTDGL